MNNSARLFNPFRSAAITRLQEFVPRAPEYAAKRNFDLPGHPHVSRLSPYVSCRLLCEEEILALVLKEHDFPEVEKLIQEVCWRTYWKGWLEMRPGVWRQYLSDRHRVVCEPDRLQTAVHARTGIECFDHWCGELRETGYLHNHARMWFASIWIFTLGLPWQLGADFFFRHLLDGDPASNTLSWRWVAGLQTPGKTYLARAENIRRFTNQRFNPEGHLNEAPPTLPAVPVPPSPQSGGFSLLPGHIPSAPTLRRGLLILGDDLSPEKSALSGVEFESIAAGWDEKMREEYRFSPVVSEFRHGAIYDALQRAAVHWNLDGGAVCRLSQEDWSGSVLAWCEKHRLEQVVVLHPAIGPWRDSLDRVRESLPEGVGVLEIIRPWDQTFWPHATRGFFPFREKIPPLLKNLL